MGLGSPLPQYLRGRGFCSVRTPPPEDVRFPVRRYKLTSDCVAAKVRNILPTLLHSRESAMPFGKTVRVHGVQHMT